LITNQTLSSDSNSIFTVYALYSVNYNKIYIGFSSNLNARLAAHNTEKGKGYTHAFRPWKIIYTEEYSTKTEAQRREKQLKSAKGREFIWNLIKSSKS
jgi:putative endonuclease